jgi:uncharacterized protein with PQ loop repeat
MSTVPEVAGFLGVVVAAAAYVPQITHLIGERCSAGISRLAFGAWLTSSVLMTAHALAIGAGVFIALGVVQVAATALILVFAVKYEHSFCASHLPIAAADAGGSVRPLVTVGAPVTVSSTSGH